jgi:hypothetical protein
MPSRTNEAVPSPAAAGLGGRSFLAGVLMGVGVAAFIDETVFHQLLHWHHFYDKGSATAGLVSDGFFHAGGWICMVAGIFVFADLQRRRSNVPTRLWAGALLGWGGFQVYDGLVQRGPDRSRPRGGTDEPVVRPYRTPMATCAPESGTTPGCGCLRRRGALPRSPQVRTLTAVPPTGFEPALPP